MGQGDSGDRQITAARVKQHFKVSVKEDVLLEAPDYCYLQVLQRWGEAILKQSEL